MPPLFDMKLRAMRRDRAARMGAELFLLDRAFEDCLERITLMSRSFERALLIGCPDASWVRRLGSIASKVDALDPGPLFARAAGGAVILEDRWDAPVEAFDLVLAIGTLDTVNDLPLAFRLIHLSLRAGGLFLGAIAGNDTLPQLRGAMRAADAVLGLAAPHVHPRIEAAALSPLLTGAGFEAPVVDLDRVNVSYSSLDRLVGDLRRMGATNILCSRPKALTRAQRVAAARAFAEAGDGGRTTETFEIVHFAGRATKSRIAR
jgi:SAM-dependent methyltransferase